MEEKEKEELIQEKEVPSKKRFKEKLEKKDEEIETLKAEVNHWKNEYYRAYADTQNLRKALEKDHHEALRYRLEGVVENLLPILDSFQMAVANTPEDKPELKNYVLGFAYIYRNLVNVLEEEGVKEIAPKEGEKFDIRTMEAVETIEDEEDNVVKKIYSNGYMLHDHLIRPARVFGSKKKENIVEDNKKEIRLKWVHKDENTGIIRLVEEEEFPEDYEVR